MLHQAHQTGLAVGARVWVGINMYLVACTDGCVVMDKTTGNEFYLLVFQRRHHSGQHTWNLQRASAHRQAYKGVQRYLVQAPTQQHIGQFIQFRKCSSILSSINRLLVKNFASTMCQTLNITVHPRATQCAQIASAAGLQALGQSW